MVSKRPASVKNSDYASLNVLLKHYLFLLFFFGCYCGALFYWHCCFRLENCDYGDPFLEEATIYAFTFRILPSEHFFDAEPETTFDLA